MKTASASTAAARATDHLETIPGIGPRMAECLRDLGCRQVGDLRGREPERMFTDICAVRGEQMDRCVLYGFRCAVYYASEDEHDPDLLKWWSWRG